MQDDVEWCNRTMSDNPSFPSSPIPNPNILCIDRHSNCICMVPVNKYAIRIMSRVNLHYCFSANKLDESNSIAGSLLKWLVAYLYNCVGRTATRGKAVDIHQKSQVGHPVVHFVSGMWCMWASPNMLVCSCNALSEKIPAVVRVVWIVVRL